MKIAIVVSKNTGLDSPVDSHFGRAHGFLLVDSDTRNFEFITNQKNMNASQGAGIQTAKHILDTQPDAVIAGHCGPNAFQVLNAAANVRVCLDASGTASQVLDSFIADQLTTAQSANANAHNKKN